MRVIPLSLALALFALWVPAAHAQTEDEEILEEPVDEQPPQRQSKRDDELDDEDLDRQVFYSGMSIERVMTDYDNLGEAMNLGGVIGFRVPTVPWIGLEIDIAQTIIPGEYREPEGATPALPPGCGTVLNPCTTPAQPAENGAFDADQQEFAMQALGAGVAFKTQGRFYVAGKYSWRYIATSNDTINEDRSGKGFGFGVGYRWGRGHSGVELGYKELAKDVEAVGLTFFVRTAAGR